MTNLTLWMPAPSVLPTALLKASTRKTMRSRKIIGDETSFCAKPGRMMFRPFLTFLPLRMFGLSSPLPSTGSTTIATGFGRGVGVWVGSGRVAVGVGG